MLNWPAYKNKQAVARMKRVIKSHNFCEWPDGYMWKYTLRHNSSVRKKKEKNLLHITETGFENVKMINSAPDHTSIEPVRALFSLINQIQTA